MLAEAHEADRLKFFGDHAALADRATFKRPSSRRCAGANGWSTPRSRSPGREQVLRYLSRYTHRVAISNRRLVAADDERHRVPVEGLPHRGPDRWKTMTLARTSSSAAS